MNGAPSVPMGTMLAARWIVGGPLGVGENGEVYEAEEAQGGRLCAVKILHPELRRGGPAWSTFQSEVRAVSALPADAVARVYDLGIDGKLHRAFVVCERVMFPSLARHVAEQGPLAPAVFNQALMTLARALDAMHAASVTHGAIKPQNIFVSAEHPSWARLTDYGLARLRIAVDPKYAGTPGWAAPELAAGVAPQPSGDLYALGMIAFFALTGMPWISALGDRNHRIPTVSTPASARARELGGVLDPAFDVWFKAALASDPAARYSSATEMAKSFAALVDSMQYSAEGPLSGPGVATAIARPLLFLRDLPGAGPQPAAEPPPSTAHPFSPTQHAMPAIQQALDAQAQAFADQRHQATAPTAPAMPAITAPGYEAQAQYAPAATYVPDAAYAPAATYDAPAATYGAPAATYGAAPVAAAGPSAFERASGLSRKQFMVVAAVTGFVLLAVLAVGAVTLIKRGDAPEETSVAADEATSAPAAAPPAPA
ncbi:MAG TPA: protein kinase, partial [Polyangiaceae bacterium]|nr:protein kinase [Polyangiaceae bacterium]